MTAEFEVGSLDQEGRGVAHAEGKVVFIEGALTGETVTATPYRRKPTFDLAKVDAILKPSASRVRPECPHFGVCGGCSMQHLDYRAQVAVKQRVLEDNLTRIAKVPPPRILPAVLGEPWGYRYRARLSVRNVPKKGGVLVGFHERKSSYVADMQSCRVIPRRISDLLLPLRALVMALSLSDRLPQIELAIGAGVDALVLRILQPLTADDEALLRAFADRHGVQFFLQTGGPDTAVPFYPSPEPLLHYELPEFGLRLAFLPTEFTQVNHAVNTVLVRRAIGLLDPQPGERVADFFCGLGNFSLAIARRGATVFGVEGDQKLVNRAQANAALNGLAASADFAKRDLFTFDPADFAQWGRFDRMLIDPPRDGAIHVVKSLPGEALPRRIVYVSCNPATLARDAAVLVHERGYVLDAAGVVNMFPHTAHVESVAVFNLAPAGAP